MPNHVQGIIIIHSDVEVELVPSERGGVGKTTPGEALRLSGGILVFTYGCLFFGQSLVIQ